MADNETGELTFQEDGKASENELKVNSYAHRDQESPSDLLKQDSSPLSAIYVFAKCSRI